MADPRARIFVAMGVVSLGLTGVLVAVLLAEPPPPAPTGALVGTGGPLPPPGVVVHLPGPGILQCGDGSVQQVDAGAAASVAPPNGPLPCTFNQGRQTVCAGDIPLDVTRCTCAPDTGRIVCEP